MGGKENTPYLFTTLTKDSPIFIVQHPLFCAIFY